MNNKKQGKKKFILIAAILAVATVIATVFVAQTTGENQGYRTISVVEVSGRVSVVKDGIEYSAYPGMLLQEGHEIITSGDSFVRLVLDDDKYIKLEAGSRVVFETLGVIGSGKTCIRLERGAITNELIQPLGVEDEYIINTPNAVLAVRGTFFRVDLTITDAGDTKADVMTYGGQVSSQRILPTGEVVEEEVLIEAGYKTTINMDKTNTIYVVDEVDGILDTTGDGVADLAPILTPDISDDDMVDIYFAAENGHELFVTAEEAKADLEAREIIIEEHTPVYEKVEEVKKESEVAQKPTGGISNTTSASIIADDSQPLAKVEEQTKEDSNTSTVGSNSSGSGLIDGVHVHKERKTTIEPTCTEDGSITVTCRECKKTLSVTEVPALGHTAVAENTTEVHSKCVTCGEVLSTEHEYVNTAQVAAGCTEKGSSTYACDCGHEYTEEIAATGHTEVNGGTADAHRKCTTCGEILNAVHSYKETITQAASCTEAGSKLYTCDCGYEYTEEVAALGHTPENSGTADVHSRCATCGEVLSTEHEYVNTAYVAASCTEKGSSTYTCDCGHEYTEEIAAIGHTEVNGGTADAHRKCTACGEVLSTEHEYVNTAQVAAGCTEKGSSTYACDCGHEYTEEIAATGHIEIDGGTADAHRKCTTCGEILNAVHSYKETITQAASCTEAGSKLYTCDCGYEYTEEVAALGHTSENSGTADVHSRCAVCGEVLSTEHEYVNTAYVAASCTEKGSSTYTCDCGHEYTEEIAATGHTEVNGGTADAHRKCTACGETLSTEHEYVNTAQVAAGCTEKGSSTYACNCGHEYTEEIAATGHTEIDGGTADAHTRCLACNEVLSTAHSYTETVTQTATCTDTGIKLYACDCGHEYTEEVAALGHTSENSGTEDVHSRCAVCGEVLSTEHEYINTAYVAASCTEKGSSTYTCDCGHEYTEEIAAIGHTEVNGGTADAHTRCLACNEVLSTAHSYTETVTQTATCTDTGIKLYACDCGHEYTEEIAATGHTEVNGGTVDAHTTCSVCSEVLSTAHSYTDTVTKEASCEEAGETTHTCDCGYIYTSEIAALGHDYVAQTEEPTDTENGREYEACSQCGAEINEKQIIALNSVNFPDVNFRAYLENAHNRDGVAGLSEDEIATVTSLVLKGDGEEDVISVDGGIYDLTGIEYFTELTELNCGYNANLTALDVSQNTKLTSLIVPCTGITTLNIDGCTELQTLTLDYCTSLTALDISSATKLVELSVKGTNLPDITLGSTYGDLTLLDIRGTDLSTFKFYKFQNLQILKADATLSEMDLDSCNNLMSLYIGAGTTLETLKITMTSLETVTFEGTTGITSINACQAVRLNSINPSMCPELETLNLAGTGIHSIDLSQNTELTTLYLENSSSFYELNLNGLSKLSTLTLTDCTLLQFLELEGTAITTLDLTGCTLLNSLNISSITSMNSISDITIPSDVPLQDFKMDDTSMTFEEADKENMGWFANLTAFRASNAGIDDSKWAIIHEQLSTNLATLDVSANASGFTTLDASKYTALASLSVTDCTGLTSISVSGCTALKELDVSTCTSLVDVDVSGSGLEVFESSNATLKTLDVSNTPMYALALSDTSVTTLNLDSMPNLTQVNIINTPLTTVTVNNTTISEVLYLNDITSLTSLVATNSTINQVTVEGCTSLQTLNVAGTGAGDVSFVGCPELVTVDISGTNMTQLLLTAASYTKLTTLSMADCPALTAISIDDLTTLTSLDVSGSTKLANLYMSSTNGLESIDVTNAGSESENGLTITITTDAYTTTDFTGWDDSYMALTTAS